MSKWKQNLITAAVSFVVAAGVLFAIIGTRGVFAPSATTEEVLRHLTDGFLISGGLILGIALLVWAGTKGTFDGIGYGVSSLINMRWTGSKMDWHKKESFSEYRDRKDEKRKRSIWIPIAIVGGAFIVVSLVILGVYYAVV